MRKVAYVILLILCANACYSQVDMSRLSNWKRQPAPVSGDSIAKHADSKSEWFVIIKNGIAWAVNNYKPPALPFRVVPGKNEKSDLAGKICFLKVDDGYLVGFNRDKQGGSLYWFSSNGQKHYKISNDKIIQFIRRDGTNYAIQGLAHLAEYAGSIIKIEKLKNRWLSKEYLGFSSAPCAITIDSDKNFLVITVKSLFQVDSTATIHTLINRGLWWNNFSPTSIVVKDSLIYSGMRGGVYEYNSYSGDKTWLTVH